MKTKITSAIADIYKELDAELDNAAPACRACGECCHFESKDYILYSSALEVEFVLSGMGDETLRSLRNEGLSGIAGTRDDVPSMASSESPTALFASVGAPSHTTLARERSVCPLLSGEACSVRERRPLGCRVYFCDPSWRSCEQDIYNRYHRRLAAIAERYGMRWEYAPMTELLIRRLSVCTYGKSSDSPSATRGA